MVQLCSVADRDQVVDTMIALTHLSNLHRAIIAGSGAMELYLSLRRRGFVQVATTATCRLPRRQHGIGLLTGAMGCVCAGALGLAGLLVGFALSAIPGLVAAAGRRRSAT